MGIEVGLDDPIHNLSWRLPGRTHPHALLPEAQMAEDAQAKDHDQQDTLDLGHGLVT
jgi:hypothetical protein